MSTIAVQREVVMPNIRIDDEVFAKLQALAEPFVDDPNSVLRRVLGLVEAPQRTSRGRPRRTNVDGNPHRAHSSELLPQPEYYLPILQAVADEGGARRSGEAVEAVGETLHDQLKPKDFEEISSGVVRWRNRTRWAAQRLKEGGLLVSRNRGIWELTEAGREAVTRGELPEFETRSRSAGHDA